jgi:uncharacterized membrane-anchored protein YjiN (DUF445 family)
MTSVATTVTRDRPAAEPPLAPLRDEAGRRAELNRMKRRATGLLVLMTAVFVAARLAEDRWGWMGYVRATAEASMVGGLADWFAVTALFRHPLGIPIPHTAVIPTRKDQIGKSLGEFLQDSFLSATILSERLHAARVGERLAVWLARPENAGVVARYTSDALAGLTDVLRDEDVQEVIEETLLARARSTPLAPLAGKALGVLTAGGRHHELLDATIRGFDRWLEENRAELRGTFEQRSPWWVPEPIDDRIFAKVYGGLRSLLHEVVADPRHELRQQFDRRVRELVDELQTSPDLIARGEQLKEDLLANPAVRRWAASLWGDLKAELLAQTAAPDSPLRRRIAGAAQGVGERLQSDPVLRTKVEQTLVRVVTYALEQYHGEISDLIESMVERWDPDETAGRLELLLGRDLQLIRINGTIVGGLAGLAIYSFAQLL